MPARQKPIKLWTADFETRGIGGEFTLGYIWDGTQGEFYYSIPQFIDICNRIGLTYKDNLNTVYFHNFDYDSRYIVVGNVQHVDTMKSLFIDNSMAVLKFKKSMGAGYRNIEFRDSLKLFQGGDAADLHSVTEGFGVEHVKMEKTSQFRKYDIECQYKKKYACEQWTDKEVRDKCPHQNECVNEYFNKVQIDDPWYKEYCAVDCKGLYEALVSFKTEIDGIAKTPIRLGYTLASTAMRLYRYMEQQKYDIIMENKRHEEENGCLPIVREAYRGGRCEVFKRYGRDLHSYDVNSLYPSVMRRCSYPINPSRPQHVSISDFTWMRRNRKYVIHARVKAPNLILPILSVNMVVPGAKDVKYLFPVGELEGYWCSPEFDYALEKGYEILEIFEVVWYGGVVHGTDMGAKTKDSFFDFYVTTLHKIKQESKGAKRMTAKLLLNSLYGKFGQRDEVHRLKFCSQQEFEDFAFEKDENGEPVNHLLQSRSISEDLVLIEYVGESHMRHNYVSLAAFTTSEARLTLYKFMELCNKLGGQVWYVDTDSLKTDILMPSGVELGQLKHEYDIKEGIFLRPKMYSCLKGYTDEGDEIKEIKNKGIMRKVLATLEHEDMRRWLFMEKVEVIPASMGEVRTPKARDIVFAAASLEKMVRGKSGQMGVPVHKTQILKDDKRWSDANKIDTFPLGYDGARVDQCGRKLYGEGPMNVNRAQELREQGGIA